MREVAELIGALVPTYLISRLFIWALRMPRLSKASVVLNGNLASFVTASAVLYVDENLRMIWMYVIAQSFWVVVDLKRVRKGMKPARRPSDA